MTRWSGEREVHDCIAEEELIEVASGACSRERAFHVLGEVERCEDCHALMLEALRALGEQSTLPSLGSGAKEAAQWTPGTLVAGRYRVVRSLGRGGMGVVYEALDTYLTQRVALKTLTADLARHETSLERLKQEVKLARRVVHPNVCRVLEFGRHRDADGERHFLTMELLEGEPLSAVLRREGSLAPQAASGIVRQLAQGLSAIHAQNIVHRDVKSSNVLMTAEGDALRSAGSPRAVLLDFGIARSLDVQSPPLTTHGLVGTPDYMAPEQLRGEAVSPATDVYALGLVWLELLCGRLPRGVAHECPLPPSVPAELGSIIRWCLSPEPAARPANMEVLLRALESPAPAPGREGARGRADYRRVAVAVFALAVAAGGGLALFGSGPAALGGGESTFEAASKPATASSGPPLTPLLEPPAPSSAPGARAALVAEPLPVSEPPAAKAPSGSLSRVRLSAPEAARGGCSPPYYYDEQGIRIYRKECL